MAGIKVQGLNHTGFVVTDLERAIGFCRDLLGMSNMFRDCTFEGDRVDLHAGSYINCVFKRCELVFDGNPVHLEGNTFSGCHWTFAGATMNFLELLCRNDPNVAREVGCASGSSANTPTEPRI